MANFTIDNGAVQGKPIAKWTEDWWKWALNLTDEKNPFTHPDGTFAAENNDGSVFFISGVSQSHSFDVPAGHPLLVPLINFIDVPPEVYPNPNKNTQLTQDPNDPAIHATENKNIHNLDNSVTSLFAKVDGVAITDLFSHRVDSSFFDAGIAEPGTLPTDYFGKDAQGNDTGITFPGTSMNPSKSGGYWLMIDKLSPGPHKLEFGGTTASTSISVTDNINVV